MDELEVWAQALAVPAIIHVDPRQPVRALTVGHYAQPFARMALRYPSTVDVRIAEAPELPVPPDRRAAALESWEDLPSGWKADVAAVGVPGDPVGAIRRVVDLLTTNGVLVVGIDSWSRGSAVREGLRRHFGQVLPYREWAPKPALFFLASNRRFGRPLRPLPPKLARINARYLEALFYLANDEVSLVYGSGPGKMKA